MAVVPPDTVIEHLDAFLEVRRQAADLRWAASDSFHVTLAFLAAVDPWRLDELSERLARAAARRTAFAAAITGGGAFPNVGRAKVLWAGLDTDWVCLDCELMPWSAKALQLVRQQYASVAAAARIGLGETVRALDAPAVATGDEQSLVHACTDCKRAPMQAAAGS